MFCSLCNLMDLMKIKPHSSILKTAQDVLLLLHRLSAFHQHLYDHPFKSCCSKHLNFTIINHSLPMTRWTSKINIFKVMVTEKMAYEYRCIFNKEKWCLHHSQSHIHTKICQSLIKPKKLIQSPVKSLKSAVQVHRHCGFIWCRVCRDNTLIGQNEE